VRQDRASCCRKGGDPVSSMAVVRQSFQALRLGSSRQTGAAWQMELTRAVPQVAGEERAGGGPVGRHGGNEAVAGETSWQRYQYQYQYQSEQQ
jgi:hypothetical protein